MNCYFLQLLFDTYPDFKFKSSDIFSWYQPENRICFVQCNKNCNRGNKPCENFYKLAHEIGHARLDHRDYLTKIELNRMELAAWDEAEQIIAKLEAPEVPEEIIESAMESYQNHAEADRCQICNLSLIGDACLNCSN